MKGIKEGPWGGHIGPTSGANVLTTDVERGLQRSPYIETNCHVSRRRLRDLKVTLKG